MNPFSISGLTKTKAAPGAEVADLKQSSKNSAATASVTSRLFGSMTSMLKKPASPAAPASSSPLVSSVAGEEKDESDAVSTNPLTGLRVQVSDLGKGLITDFTNPEPLLPAGTPSPSSASVEFSDPDEEEPEKNWEDEIRTRLPKMVKVANQLVPIWQKREALLRKLKKSNKEISDDFEQFFDQSLQKIEDWAARNKTVEIAARVINTEEALASPGSEALEPEKKEGIFSATRVSPSRSEDSATDLPLLSFVPISEGLAPQTEKKAAASAAASPPPLEVAEAASVQTLTDRIETLNVNFSGWTLLESLVVKWRQIEKTYVNERKETEIPTRFEQFVIGASQIFEKSKRKAASQAATVSTAVSSPIPAAMLTSRVSPVEKEEILVQTAEEREMIVRDMCRDFPELLNGVLTILKNSETAAQKDRTEAQLPQKFIEIFVPKVKRMIENKKAELLSLKSAPIPSASIEKQPSVTQAPAREEMLIIQTSEERAQRILDEIEDDADKVLESWAKTENELRAKGKSEEAIQKLFNAFMQKKLEKQAAKKEALEAELKEVQGSEEFGSSREEVFKELFLAFSEDASADSLDVCKGGKDRWEAQARRFSAFKEVMQKGSDPSIWWNDWMKVYTERRSQLLTELDSPKNSKSKTPLTPELINRKLEIEWQNWFTSFQTKEKEFQHFQETFVKYFGGRGYTEAEIAPFLARIETAFNNQKTTSEQDFLMQLQTTEFNKQIKSVDLTINIAQTKREEAYLKEFPGQSNTFALWAREFERIKTKQTPEQIELAFVNWKEEQLKEKEQVARKAEFLSQFPEVIGEKLWAEWEKQYLELRGKNALEAEGAFKVWKEEANVSKVAGDLFAKYPDLKKQLVTRSFAYSFISGNIGSSNFDFGFMKVAGVISLVALTYFKSKTGLSFTTIAGLSLVIAGLAPYLKRELTKEKTLKNSWAAFGLQAQNKDLIKLQEIKFRELNSSQQSMVLHKLKESFSFIRNSGSQNYLEFYSLWKETAAILKDLEIDMPQNLRTTFEGRLKEIRNQRDLAMITLAKGLKNEELPQLVGGLTSSSEGYYAPKGSVIRSVSKEFIEDASGYTALFAVLIEGIKKNAQLANNFRGLFKADSDALQLTETIALAESREDNLDQLFREKKLGVILGTRILRLQLAEKMKSLWESDSAQIKKIFGASENINKEDFIQEFIIRSTSKLPKECYKYLAEILGVRFKIFDETGESIIGDNKHPLISIAGIAKSHDRSREIYAPYINQ